MDYSEIAILKIIFFSLFIILIIVQLIRTYLIKRYYCYKESKDPWIRIFEYFAYKFPDKTKLIHGKYSKLTRIQSILKVMFIVGLVLILLSAILLLTGLLR